MRVVAPWSLTEGLDRVLHGETEAGNWDGHLMLLFQSEEERRSGLVSWVRRGLAVGEKVIYAGVPAEAADSTFVTVLAEGGIDVDAALSGGQLELLTLSEFYPFGGPGLLVDTALGAGYPAVRLSAGPTAPLSFMSQQEHDRLERTVGEICRTRPLSALCQFDAGTTAGARLDRAAANHLDGIREHRFHTASRGNGLIMAGDFDMANADLVEATVRSAAARAEGLLRLDLGQVEFVGVAGVGALMRGSRDFREHDGQLHLESVPAPVAKVFRLLGVDSRSHTTISESR